MPNPQGPKPPGPDPQGEVTRLLKEWSRGEVKALEQLMPMVFDELRALARSHFRRESPGHTLQPTALVNEVYMRLLEQHKVEWDDRSQFFAFAALLMRRILVDHAKGRKAAKRGGGQRPVAIDDLSNLPNPVEVDMVALDEALTALGQLDPQLARIVELRYFAGLTHDEIAAVLGVSTTTVKRGWRTARLWLLREMSGRRVLSEA